MATATAKWKAKLAAAKTSASKRVAKIKQSERTKQTAALGGAVVAGALDGMQIGLEVGEFDIPAGLVAGLPIVAFGGKFSPLLEGAGLGMACFGLGTLVAEYVADMDYETGSGVEELPDGVDQVPDADGVDVAAAK